MPKRKPPRRERRRRRPMAPPPPAPFAPAPPRPSVAPSGEAALASATPAPPSRERSISRFTARDYSYVRRELQRIVLLASAIFVLIVVLSFFLP